jgi:hypothetical protein
MKPIRTALASTALLAFLTLAAGPARAQQFNSDNYLSKPHGVATIILTTGERNTMWMTTFSLLPKWEFTAAAYIFNADNDPRTDDGYSTSFYAKYMIIENQAKTGGLAVKAGTGLEPGYLNTSVQLKDAFQTYWMNAPVTVPFFGNKLSWDAMPGISLTKSYGDSTETVGSFTYATRLAWNPTSPKIALVGEVYGAEGGTRAIPEYRVGLRWEPSLHAVFAVTFDDEFHGTNGAGFEVGVMLFSPPFAKL